MKILTSVVLTISLIIIPYTPSYAWGITGGTTRGSDTKQEDKYIAPQSRDVTEAERRRGYKILETIDPTPYNAGTKLLKGMDYVGERKMNDPRARGGLFDGSVVRHRE